MNVVDNICLAPLKVRKCSRGGGRSKGLRPGLQKVGLKEKALSYPDTLRADNNSGWRLPGLGDATKSDAL